MRAVLLLMLGVHSAHAAELQLPVPTVIIYPNQTITEGSLSERSFIAHTVARSTVFEDRQALIGKVAGKTLLPGKPVAVNAVREPFVIMQGKIALVVFEASGLTITMQATALQNGSTGDVIALRNLDSGATIKGTVESDGTVRLAVP